MYHAKFLKTYPQPSSDDIVIHCRHGRVIVVNTRDRTIDCLHMSLGSIQVRSVLLSLQDTPYASPEMHLSPDNIARIFRASETGDIIYFVCNEFLWLYNSDDPMLCHKIPILRENTNLTNSFSIKCMSRDGSKIVIGNTRSAALLLMYDRSKNLFTELINEREIMGGKTKLTAEFFSADDQIVAISARGFIIRIYCIDVSGLVLARKEETINLMDNACSVFPVSILNKVPADDRVANIEIAEKTRQGFVYNIISVNVLDIFSKATDDVRRRILDNGVVLSPVWCIRLVPVCVCPKSGDIIWFRVSGSLRQWVILDLPVRHENKKANKRPLDIRLKCRQPPVSGLLTTKHGIEPGYFNVTQSNMIVFAN